MYIYNLCLNLPDALSCIFIAPHSRHSLTASSDMTCIATIWSPQDLTLDNANLTT